MSGSVLAIVEPPHGRFVAFVAPRDDAIFVERAVVALEAALTDGGGPNPEVALDRLRPTYPRVVVRRRERFAEGGVLVPAAYVYRDGNLLGEAPGETWWESPEAARLVVENGRYVAANEAALRLVNLAEEELPGRPAGDLTQPDMRVDPAWLWE